MAKWIDRELYPAVMFACKMLRDGEEYGRAIGKAAHYYGVPYDDVDREVKERSRTTEKKPFKYKYFVITVWFRDCNGETGKAYTVRKGKSRETVNDKLSELTYNYDYRHQGNGSEYSWSEKFMDIVSEHESKEEAERAASKLRGWIES